MQQDNNIEKKLQQLESQQLPDLSRMDDHWEQMQASLKLQELPGKKGVTLPKLILPLIALVIVLSLVYFIVARKIEQDDMVKSEKEKSFKPAHPAETIVLSDSVPPSAVIINTGNDDTVKQNHRFNQSMSFEPIYADPNIADLSGDSLAFLEEDVINGKPGQQALKPDQQALLANLFNQLSKAPQNFWINNKKDTTLVCNEGTMVLIPANSFGGKDSIKISITEFYKYSDMVLNRLTTMSDGAQLITGGMLRINALRNDSLIKMKLHKPVKIFVPGLTENDSMQLFTERKKYEGDSLTSSGVNWALSGTRMSTPPLMRYVRAIDFLDSYNEIRGVELGGKKKALFSISRETELSRENIKGIMKSKYPEYHKMRFRKLRKRNFFFKEYRTEVEHIYGATGQPGLGDTMYFELNKFSRYAKTVTAIDTVWSDGSWNSKGTGELVFNIETDPAKVRFAEKYSFLLDEFGWINCDRFYKYNGEKTNFYVSNDGLAGNAFTVLVFDRIKSIMEGYLTTGNRLVFQNIPVGEAVTIVSIGVNKYGKPVLASKKAIVGKQLAIIEYEEKDIDEIKNSLGVLNK